jgi:uncharacterized protein YggE
MRRREMLVAAGTALSTAVAGCLNDGSDDPAAQNGSTAAPIGSGERRVVTVTGSGEVSGDPDRALLEFEIRARAEEAGAVRNDLATRAESVRTALIEAGVDEDRITTSRFRIHERIDRRRMREADVDPDDPEARERFRFYQGTHAFEVEVEDIDAVGSTIDTAVDAGADEVGRVVFTLSEEKETELREEAIRKAVRSARSEADAIASEVDGEIVEATVVDASRGRIGPVERSGDAALAATPAPEPTPAPRTGVEPGDVTVSVDVDVRYTMR